MTAASDLQQRECALLQGYSIEMTAKDIAHLEEAADVIPREPRSR